MKVKHKRKGRKLTYNGGSTHLIYNLVVILFVVVHHHVHRQSSC